MDTYEKEILDKISKILDTDKGEYPWCKIEHIKYVTEAYGRSSKIMYNAFVSKNKKHMIDWKGNIIGRIIYPKNPIKKWLCKRSRFFSDRCVRLVNN